MGLAGQVFAAFCEPTGDIKFETFSFGRDCVLEMDVWSFHHIP
jgi:hypothetical protein